MATPDTPDRGTVEHWHLEDVEETHRRYPDTFHLPSLEERRSLQVGRSVRLHFTFDKPELDNCRAERMWVTITETPGADEFRGALENAPVYIRTLAPGDVVSFRTCHIAQILIPKGDPRWMDTTKKAIVSKRVFDSRRVGFLYREAPRNNEDSGWIIFAGNEDDEFAGDSRNFHLVSLEDLLEVDESIEEILRSEVGAVFERPPGSRDFQRVRDWSPPTK